MRQHGWCTRRRWSTTLPAVVLTAIWCSGIALADPPVSVGGGLVGGTATGGPPGSNREFSLVLLPPDDNLTLFGSMLRGDTPATENGWTPTPLLTISESVNTHLLPGIPGGLGVFSLANNSVLLTVNHELDESDGYAYTLANGTALTGARVSFIELQRNQFGYRLRNGGLAYSRAYDRDGNVVTDASQINEDGVALDGFSRFSSSFAVPAGEYGFVDDILFLGEDVATPFHPHGGTAWAIDIENDDIWAMPELGRQSWENMTPMETGNPNTVALLCGDDFESAPLYLWVGQKDGIGDNSFLDRNGLASGQLYAWEASNGDLTPQDFNGEGSARAGQFVPMAVRDIGMSGMAGHDDDGYLDDFTLRAEADAHGCFSFSRPQDLQVNPAVGNEVIFASTGRGSLFPADNWGTIYRVVIDFNTLTADLTILHDADDRPVSDAAIRSPDNVTWASDGFVYVQEDRATTPLALFGSVTGVEASLWRLNPANGQILRVAEIDRDAVYPDGTTDICAGDLGCWESSGVVDITPYFDTAPGETRLLSTIQAHGIRDGAIGGDALLVESGQIVLLSNFPN